MLDESSVYETSPAHKEALYILIEECGEVIEAATKILRHGFDNYNPTIPNSRSNKEELERELGDLMAVMEILFKNSPVRKVQAVDAMYSKMNRIHKWLRKLEI